MGENLGHDDSQVHDPEHRLADATQQGVLPVCIAHGVAVARELPWCNAGLSCYARISAERTSALTLQWVSLASDVTAGLEAGEFSADVSVETAGLDFKEWVHGGTNASQHHKDIDC